MNSEPPPTESPVKTTEPQMADDLLPPVSPPSSGFIMQLFVIPLLIVMIIIGIWLLFNWVANRDRRPVDLAQDIERLNHASWQKALTLANQLRDDRNHDLRQDRQLCDQLASQLRFRIEEGGSDQERVWLRIYLCRALGDFELGDGLPALILAAQHQESIEDVEVRRAALQAIGILINRIGTPTETDALLLALAQTAEAGSDNRQHRLRYDRLRSTAAFALGLMTDDAATSPLAKMLDDESEDVRYNAAVALARHGDERCIPWLVKMLTGEFTEETTDNESLTEDEMAQWVTAKHQLVITNALRAVSRLIDKQPSFDLNPLRAAVERVVTQESIDPSVLEEAKQVLIRIDATRSAASNRRQSLQPHCPRTKWHVQALGYLNTV
jgi:hypothetical protein